MSNALKSFIQSENNEAARKLRGATELANRAADLLRTLADTYRYETIDSKYYRLSPHPNVNCGVSIDIFDGKVVLSGRYGTVAAADREKKHRSERRVEKEFKTKVTASVSGYMDMGVSITIPGNWEKNPEVLADISLLCSAVFKHLRD